MSGDHPAFFDAELDWLATQPRRKRHPIQPCPVCDAIPHVDWIDVSTPDGRTERIPGTLTCPNDGDMAHAAYWQVGP